MDAQKLITKTYQSYVLSADIDSEFRRALKTHERVPLMITNLLKQVKEMERLGTRVTKQEIVSMTEAVTDMFLQGVRKEAEQRMLSDLAKQSIEKAAKDKADAKAAIDAITEDDGNEITVTDQKGCETSTQEVRIKSIP